MNRTVVGLLGAGVVVAIAGIILIFSMPNGDDDSSHFSAYEAGEAAATTNGADEERKPTLKRGERPDGTLRKRSDAMREEGMLKLTDDELNRPGPTGAAAEARRIKNRRPRTDEEVGKQDEPTRGELAKEDVQKGIQAVRPLVKVCYEDTLEEFPNAAGKVTLEFRIIGEDTKGRVEMSELVEDNTTLFDQKLHDCMQKSIAEAEFETPSGGGVVDVRYPFVFENDNEDN